MTDQKRITIHVAPFTLIIFSILFSPAFIVGIQSIIQKQSGGGLFFCFLYFFIVYWICSSTVYLENEILTYSTLFFIRRSANLESVTKVKITANPAPTLVLHRSGHLKPFQFAIKPFSKKGVSFIMHYIKLHTSNAEFDKISADLEQGDFASVTRETLQVQNLIRFFCVGVGTTLMVSLSEAKTHSMPLTAGIVTVAVLILIIRMSRKKRS